LRTRKKEITQLVELLEQPHDSVEELAETIWKQIDEYRAVREAWIIGVHHGQGITLMYGLYDTENSAMKDLKNFRSTTGQERVGLFKILHPSAHWGGQLLGYK
jgi:hypothetical protein